MKLALITSNEHRYIKSLQPDLVIIDNLKSPVIDFCSKNNIDFQIVDFSSFIDREVYDESIMKILEKNNIDLVILGGYKKLIKSKNFLDSYYERIINIHNSFLPDFSGYNPHESAFNAGAKESGYTLHYVDSGIDTGRIIYQEKTDVSHCKSSQEVYDLLVESCCSKIKEIIKNIPTLNLKNT